MFEHVMEPLRQRSARQTSPQAKAVLEISDREDWNVRVLGRAPLPRTPVRAGNWLVVPLEVDGSPIPAKALKRVRTMYEAGIRPKGFVIIHEAPPFLKAGAGAAQPDTEHVLAQHPAVEPTVAAGLAAAAILLIIVPLVAKVIVGVVAALAAATAVPAAAAGIATAALVDPMLVAVTEDGYWISIFEWWTN